jgi:hypothetical protein
VTANDDGSYRLVWKAPGVRKVTVMAGGKVVARGGSRGEVPVRRLRVADRQWFDLVPERVRSLHLADRLLRLDGAVNFRDAGGYRTKDGHWVKLGEVYRSDALNHLTESDLAKLERLDIDGRVRPADGVGALGRPGPCAGRRDLRRRRCHGRLGRHHRAALRGGSRTAHGAGRAP